MKAAVINNFGETPQYKDFKEPTVSKEGISIQVKAAVLENFDQLTASGNHFASQSMFTEFPAIVGHSGVGTLADGSLVTFGGTPPPYGTMAEKVMIPKERMDFIQKVPEGISASVAAALPAAALTSYLPLKYSAHLIKGQNVLVNGATGVSGKLAVQIAKLLGAKRVIGTGRDEKGLKKIKSLGTDQVVDLKASEDKIFKDLQLLIEEGIDIVLDFVWAPPTALLLKALTPKEVGIPKHVVQLIQIGQAAGEEITLKAEMLRTSGVEIKGVGKMSKEHLQQATDQIWKWAAAQKLEIEIEEIPLKEISSAWKRKVKGKRLVMVP